MNIWNTIIKIETYFLYILDSRLKKSIYKNYRNKLNSCEKLLLLFLDIVNIFALMVVCG